MISRLNPLRRPPAPRTLGKIASSLLGLASLCTAGCSEAPPPVDAGGAIVVPASVASAAPKSAAPPTTPPAPPPSKPHATLFKGATPAVPAVFEGLTPEMPLLAARVLFPQLPKDQHIRAPYAGLRFIVYIIGEQVYRLGIATTQGAPAGAALRSLIASTWGPGAPAKDDSGRILTLWFAPEAGLRVLHQGEPDGRAEVFFDAFMPIKAFVDETLPLLRAQIGRTPAQVRDAFEASESVEGGVEARLPALAFGRPTVARLPTDPKGERVEAALIDLSFAFQPAFKGEIFKALKASLGRAKRDPDVVEGYDFKGARLDAKADRWRLTLR